MSDTVIKVENLSKRYILAHEATQGGFRYKRFSDVIANAVTAPFRALKKREGSSATREEFWALRDVSFEINQGEVVGIIGRNGAGKSTLLKILSRITDPTSGRIEIEGRVASLLEVGTGFHPELTGRENIYLNGAILGMSRAEIKKKFDEIVDFAEVEKFLDTPVRFYSSGMYVRLAFAVAAHLEPEILIVDEVLAVGDAQFQKKCLGKMQDVSTKEGRTVLFVSHNMAALTKLCSTSILLNGGRIQAQAPTEEVVPLYLKSGAEATGVRSWENDAGEILDSRFRMRALRVFDHEGAVSGHMDIRRSFSVEMEYRVTETIPQFRVSVWFLTMDGTVVFVSSDSTHSSYDQKDCRPGLYKARCHIPGNLLNEGSYILKIGADIPHQKLLFIEESALQFSVEQTGGVTGRFAEKFPGVVCPQLEWESEQTGD